MAGLSEPQAAERLRRDGPNELPSSRPRSALAIAWNVIKEPIFLLLVACGTIYILLGDTQEALMLLGFVFLVTAISFYQEQKTERTLEALRDLTSPRALVIRGGMPVRIPGREVVRGDLIILSEGDRVPADARVLEATHLSADESLLTGESFPVRKRAATVADQVGQAGGDDLPFVYSGTMVVQGRGIAEVEAVGPHTVLGKIGRALQGVALERTHLQQETARWVRHLAILGGVLCLIVVLLHGLGRGNWLTGILSGLTLAMAVLPNELPVVLTIFMALGAWRISKHNVLTRRVPVIETLGSASVLCVDKTGTVTMNQMSVRILCTGGETYDANEKSSEQLAETFHSLGEFSLLANHRAPFDPMERALNEFGKARLAGTDHLHQDWELVREYPLSPKLLALSQVWKSPGGEDYVVATKGAPEAIIDLCHGSSDQKELILARVGAMADLGLRVLGVARAYFRESELPGQQHDFNFEFLGLIGLADPVRAGVADAVAECYSAGIQVVMITGDYSKTAISIAREIGLKNPDQCITGPELDAMDDEALQRRVRTTNIFARVVPEQKLRLVRAFKATGQIVAMTGDGVNDAPALKAADIGIAMGGRGTDVDLMALLCAGLGLRASELLGLQWGDVDWLQSTLAIRRGIVRQVTGDTKTAESAKTVTLAPGLLELLKLWKGQTQFAQGQDWIFASPVQLGALPWSYPYVWKVFRNAARNASVGSISPHVLRHTYRAWLADSSAPLELQSKMMRHTDIRQTLRYGDRKMLNQMSEIGQQIAEVALSGLPVDCKPS
jgi:Ca2+-transporting ATPase